MALKLEDYLGESGRIELPTDTTICTYLDRNFEAASPAVAYRYLDFGPDQSVRRIDLSWQQMKLRVCAVAARLQQVTQPGDRVAILAPQGVDYVVAFFAAIKAGCIAVPLFAPEMAGQAERLDNVVTDAQPTVVLTTTDSAERVRETLRRRAIAHRPRMIAVDAVPETLATEFRPMPIGMDDIAYLQYTSGSTRKPAGVEITHRSVCTNVLQMVMAVGLDWDIRSVSWLPLFHDMGLLMIMFPALLGGHITLMSPSAFIRRPYRWIRELGAGSEPGRVFAAAPNFAFDLAATRGLPPAGEELDLSNVAGLINGSEPVSAESISRFHEAFAPYGLAPTAVKPSYGLAEATLFVSTTDPADAPRVIYLDRHQLGAGHAVQVEQSDPAASTHVACGHVAPSQWAVIVDAATGAELPDGEVGEIWLHGDNVGSGYWGRPVETETTFRNKLQSKVPDGSHAEDTDTDALWLRTGDLGVYVGGELFITGRVKDVLIVDGRNHYPQDIEHTVAQATPAVRAGFVVAFAVPGPSGREELVIVAERAAGFGRVDPESVITAIRAAVSRGHGLAVADIRLVSAGAVPRTTSGKLARQASRSEYLAGAFGGRPAEQASATH
ncbi:long-chain-fatty-acid--AMP ligase FadD32 [Mycolicibacterium canariasense]|uniref:Long-chain-fatty-acid--AMP ligase FadD32 n=1 Tax=Mycolicibacterium canariasense TaxID=228230 RepID=A0A100WGV8_MYCCR|nr:fatty acyl-AMP ligase [Mycolicibacterium canariasense]MCV7212465.1 AMP-binding protein [Mycolicibacterium canariasense]ORV15478.1 fatty-acid--CoA ligase [Mycolicibacterium canariasense]GAS97961.1 long-chain-fatty-acid--AMP ligase FadD32 [Mycolicibacterium canariasense]